MACYKVPLISLAVVFPLPVVNVYVSLALLRHKLHFNSNSSFYRQFRHRPDVQPRSVVYWKLVPSLNKNKPPHGPADSQNLVWVKIRCVWVCGDAMYLTFGRLRQQLVGRKGREGSQEAMEHFHLSAYGTSTKPVVITVSTIAGVHIILVLKITGNRNEWKSLPKERT